MKKLNQTDLALLITLCEKEATFSILTAQIVAPTLNKLKELRTHK